MFAKYGNRNIDNDVGMQRDGNREVSHGLEWTLRQTNLCLVDVETLFGQCFCDIEVGDGTEQTTIDPRFLQNLDGQTFQLFALCLCIGQFFGCCLFKFSASCLEVLNGCCCCTTSHALGDQKGACIAVLDLDDIAQIAEIADFFQQNNLHFFLQYSLD